MADEDTPHTHSALPHNSEDPPSIEPVATQHGTHGHSGLLPLLQQASPPLWIIRDGVWLPYETNDETGGETGALHEPAVAVDAPLDEGQHAMTDRRLPRIITVAEGVPYTRSRAEREELHSEGGEPAAAEPWEATEDGRREEFLLPTTGQLEIAEDPARDRGGDAPLDARPDDQFEDLFTQRLESEEGDAEAPAVAANLQGIDAIGEDSAGAVVPLQAEPLTQEKREAQAAWRLRALSLVSAAAAVVAIGFAGGIYIMQKRAIVVIEGTVKAAGEVEVAGDRAVASATEAEIAASTPARPVSSPTIPSIAIALDPFSTSSPEEAAAKDSETVVLDDPNAMLAKVADPEPVTVPVPEPELEPAPVPRSVPEPFPAPEATRMDATMAPTAPAPGPVPARIPEPSPTLKHSPAPEPSPTPEPSPAPELRPVRAAEVIPPPSAENPPPSPTPAPQPAPARMPEPSPTPEPPSAPAAPPVRMTEVTPPKEAEKTPVSPTPAPPKTPAPQPAPAHVPEPSPTTEPPSAPAAPPVRMAEVTPPPKAEKPPVSPTPAPQPAPARMLAHSPTPKPPSAPAPPPVRIAKVTPPPKAENPPPTLIPPPHRAEPKGFFKRFTSSRSSDRPVREPSEAEVTPFIKQFVRSGSSDSPVPRESFFDKRLNEFLGQGPVGIDVVKRDLKEKRAEYPFSQYAYLGHKRIAPFTYEVYQQARMTAADGTLMGGNLRIVMEVRPSKGKLKIQSLQAK